MSVMEQISRLVQGGSPDITARSHGAMNTLRAKIAEAKEVIGVYDTQSEILSTMTPIPVNMDDEDECKDHDWVTLCRSQVIKVRDRSLQNPSSAASRHVSYIVRPFRGLVIPPHAHQEEERVHVIAGAIRNLLTDEVVSHNSNLVLSTPPGVLHGYVVLEDSVLVVTYSNN